MIKKLATYLPTIILEEERDVLDHQIDQFHLENGAPAIEKTDGTLKQLDEWWGEVFDHLPQYQTLYKLIKACLSIFTGPMIEQSFRYFYFL